MKRIVEVTEETLWQSRLLVLFAVFSSLIASAALFIIGTVITLNTIFSVTVSSLDPKNVYREIISLIITAMDVYLIGTVLLIFSLGLYDLFVKPIEKMKTSKILSIPSLDDLKSKLLKVVVIVLVVTYFKYALDYEYTTLIELMLLAGGTVLVAISAYLSHKGA
ncbi:YqhA family protein [Ferroglobus sp.]|uniref:YqhA family protein n=1 Tax=Ferroglobus sp. TaxID=2614230 RepID=UPI0025BE6F22|nr:YqhA family protein [Ferroglobus sp.]